jgi:NAD(P)-dependent dehydrogenase (short-subunit alcohol dehydrogenase family)
MLYENVLAALVTSDLRELIKYNLASFYIDYIAARVSSLHSKESGDKGPGHNISSDRPGVAGAHAYSTTKAALNMYVSPEYFL